MDPLRHVKPTVREITAYALSAREAAVKINQNENPYDLPEATKRRVLEKALSRPWCRYPDLDPKELLAALAGFSGWRADGILAGNGSNELIEALLMVTVGPGTRVVIPEPTFALYAHLTRILGGDPVRVPLVPGRHPGTRRSGRGGEGAAGPADSSGDAPDSAPAMTEGAGPDRAAPTEGAGADGALGIKEAPGVVYDVAALVGARRGSGAAVTVVCSPNNPTGSSLPPSAIERLCEDGDGLVVIDEAYHEFAGETAVPLLEEHPNLVVLRTFSKAMALAGLRVGYLLASPELVREVNKARLPYNLNFFSQSAALAALEESAALEEAVGRIVDERERILGRLRDVPGVRAWPSRANFFLLELLAASPRPVFDSLHRRRVLVRDVTGYPSLSRCLRVSVGTPRENEEFLRALGAALGEAGVDLATGRA